MNTGSRIIIYYITDGARELSERVQKALSQAECVRYTGSVVAKQWDSARAMVFIMASGIAVRSVAPLLKDKKADPAILVMDEKGEHVVSLAGGHEAGANDLAREIASAVKASPVITTGTDAAGLTSIDVFARDRGLAIENRDALPSVSKRHIHEGDLKVYSDIKLELPKDLRPVQSAAAADVVISSRINETKALLLRPRELTLGMGINTGTSPEEVEEAVVRALDKEGLSVLSLARLATHEKKTSEEGFVEFARKHGMELIGFTTEELNAVAGVEESAAARKALGVNAVAEPSALLGSGSDELLMKKVKDGNVTIAICASMRGVLSVVGTGPGGVEHMTPEALRVIGEADVVVGFKSYLALIEPLIAGKEVISSAMTEEVKRVQKAVELSEDGKRVALVSGGDPGVYAMAGLAYEVVSAMNAMVEVNVVPGISALNACAARLGAPLMHDFCAISLSDRLTPWEQIEKRLEAAGKADFVIALYNPKSRGRKTQIERAREIILMHRDERTPVGIVRSAMREDERVVVTDLDSMLKSEIDMKSTVIIGNSKSFRWRGRLITPRGYEGKYELG